MFSIRRLCMLLALVVASLAASGQSWQSLNGPTRPHEVLDLSIGKTANTHLIYAVDVDTMKISTDGGRSWVATGASLTQPLAVACQVASPSVAIMARQGKETSIYRTTNGGTSWNDVGPNATYDLQPQRVAFSAADDQFALLGTERTPSDEQTTLWGSTNGGGSWFAIDYFKDEAHTFVNDILLDPSDANNAYVVGSSRDVVDDPFLAEETENPLTKGFWRSTDKGVNWTPAGNLSSTDNNLTAVAISVYGNTGLFVGSCRGKTASARIYQSNNNGDTWSLSATLPSGMTQIRAIAVNPSNQQMIIAATNAGLYMTTNRGSNWSTNNTNVPDVAKNIYDFAFDLRSNDTAYIATGASVYKGVFSSGSWSWTASVTGSNTLNPTAISVRSDVAFAVSSSWTGISKYSGGSWNLVSSIKKFAGYSVSTHSSDGSKVFAGGKVGNKAALYQTANTGSTWSEGFSSVASTVVSCVLADQKNNSTWVWAGIGGTGVPTNNIRITTNNGTDWTSDQTYHYGTEVNAIAANASSGSGSSTEMYAGLDSYGVDKSTNGGSGWSALGPNLYDMNAIALNSATSTLAQTVYFGSTASVWKSTNSGGTMSQLSISSFSGARKLLMHPSYSTSANFVWAIPDNGQSIYQTTDGGSTWSEVSTSSLTKPLNDLQRDASNSSTIYVATAAGVYKINPAPMIPTGVSGSGSAGQHPTISWTANIEDDLAGYKIYRTECNSADYDSIATVSKEYTSYQDMGRTIASGGDGTFRYRIKAYDDGENSSDNSAYVGFNCETRGQKAAGGAGEELPSVLALHPCYPNPFNPTTEMRFDLPEPAVVSLAVYDLLGRKVADLVCGHYDAGYHSTVWNAADMASGVYFARFTVKNELGSTVYTKTNKLVLMK
jgi:hypothetical protein